MCVCVCLFVSRRRRLGRVLVDLCFNKKPVRIVGVGLLCVVLATPTAAAAAASVETLLSNQLDDAIEAPSLQSCQDRV